MTFATKFYFILSAVLLIGSAGICLAFEEHTCISDWFPTRIGKTVQTPTTAIHGVSNNVNSSASKVDKDGFAPIRIKVFMGGYCTELGPHPKTKNRRISSYYRDDCKDTNILTPERVKLLTENIIPAAVKLHTDRLLVKPIHGVKVPAMVGICKEFKIPEEHRKNGVPDADMVFYLSALPTFGSEYIWATTCATIDGRPAVGVINVGPDMIVDRQHSVRAAAHAMAHALGFTFDKMKELGMTKIKKGVRQKSSVTIVHSNKTVEMTRKHFDCETAEGMELEDESVTMPIPSHWERRNAKDELMSAITGAGYYTALTLAAFQDMGFYRANFSNAEPMRWGNASKCALLEEPCVTEGTTKYPNMFCTHRSTYECTSDRLGVGLCKIITDLKDVPKPYQYFKNARLSGDKYSLMDYCPIIIPMSNTMCADGEEELMPGSLVGPSARCLTGRGLVAGKKPIGGVCAKVLCKEGNLLVNLRGESEWRSCNEGEEINDGASFTSGSIICPSYSEICTVADSSMYPPLEHVLDAAHSAKTEDEHHENYGGMQKPKNKTHEPASKGKHEEGEAVQVNITLYQENVAADNEGNKTGAHSDVNATRNVTKNANASRHAKRESVSIRMKRSFGSDPSTGTVFMDEGIFVIGDGSVRAAFLPIHSLILAVAVVAMATA